MSLTWRFQPPKETPKKWALLWDKIICFFLVDLHQCWRRQAMSLCKAPCIWQTLKTVLRSNSWRLSILKCPKGTQLYWHNCSIVVSLHWTTRASHATLSTVQDSKTDGSARKLSINSGSWACKHTHTHTEAWTEPGTVLISLTCNCNTIHG